MPAIEKMASPSSDGAEDISTPASGRTRRTAAVASKNAWQALMPHKKGAFSGDEDDGGEYSEKPTPKERRKRTTAASQTGSRKRPRASKALEMELPDSTPDEDEEQKHITERVASSMALPPTAGGRKILVHQQEKSSHNTMQSTLSNLAENRKAVHTPNVKPKSEKSLKAFDTPLRSGGKQQQKQQNLSPQREQQSLSTTGTATAHSVLIRPKASILGKRASILSPKSELHEQNAIAHTETGEGQRIHQRMLLKSGAGALNKEELEEIEREVEKHRLDEHCEAGGFRNGSNEGDDQYNEYPSCPPKTPSSQRGAASTRGARGGARSAGASGSARGTSRASVNGSRRGRRGGISGRGGGEGGTRGGGEGGTRGGGVRRANSSAGPDMGGAGEYKSAGSVVGPAVMMNAPRPMNGGGKVTVLRYRPNGASMPNSSVPGRGAVFPMTSSSAAMSALPARPSAGVSLGPLSSMYASLSREVNEVAARYADRVVPGTTVQEFNNIVDQIGQELNRVLDEKTRLAISHREYMDQTNLAHAAELDMKEKKIQELELTVETLQSKLMVAMKRIQLNALKNDTVTSAKVPVLLETKATTGGQSSSENTSAKDSKSKEHNEATDADTKVATASKDEEKAKAPTQRVAPRVYAPLSSSVGLQQQQKVAPRPLSTLSSIRQQPSRMNAFRYYDGEDDNDGEDLDEEEEEEERNDLGANMPKVVQRPITVGSRFSEGGVAVSGPGGGSIFKSAVGPRTAVPMSLNAMNGQRMMLGYSGKRVYPTPLPSRRLDDSEDGFMDEDEEDELDEMEADEDLALTAAERRQLASLTSRSKTSHFGGSGLVDRRTDELINTQDEADNDYNGDEKQEHASMVIGTEELVDGGEVGANQTVL